MIKTYPYTTRGGSNSSQVIDGGSLGPKHSPYQCTSRVESLDSRWNSSTSVWRGEQSVGGEVGSCCTMERLGKKQQGEEVAIRKIE